MRDDDVHHTNKVKTYASLIKSEMHFQPDDKPQTGKFILDWMKTEKDSVDRRSKPYWMYIHEIIYDGVETDDGGYKYTTLAIERNDRPVPPVPFELTQKVIDKFCNFIRHDDRARHLIQTSDDFILERTFQAMNDLIEAIKKP